MTFSFPLYVHNQYFSSVFFDHEKPIIFWHIFYSAFKNPWTYLQTDLALKEKLFA